MTHIMITTDYDGHSTGTLLPGTCPEQQILDEFGDPEPPVNAGEYLQAWKAALEFSGPLRLYVEDACIAEVP